MSEKNTMTRNAMLFLPAKVLEGVLLLLMSSLYTHIFTKDAAGAFGFVQQTMNFAYLLVAAWMANSSTRYAAEEFKRDKASGLLSTMTVVYILMGVVGVASCAVLGAVTGDSRFLPGAVMFCTYTAFTILINTLVLLDRVRPAILFSLVSASLKLIVAIVLVGGKSNFPDPTPGFIANIIADGVGALGAVFALGMPSVVRFKRASRQMLNKLLAYGVPLMGVALCSGLLTLFDRFYIYGVFGDATGGHLLLQQFHSELGVHYAVSRCLTRRVSGGAACLERAQPRRSQGAAGCRGTAVSAGRPAGSVRSWPRFRPPSAGCSLPKAMMQARRSSG